MSELSVSRRRFEPSSLTALLVAGDMVAIGVFVVVGEITHGYSLTADAGRILGTLVQFLLGWALVSVPAGLYTPDAVDGLRSPVLRTLGAWGVAVVVAQAVRATALFPGNAAVTFALVSFGVGGGLLVGWRVVVSLLR